jgi:DNA modification methylase
MADNNTKIIVGHALDVLKTLPSESVDCVVTSPPYWGLRDYNTEPVEWPDGWVGQLGLEPTPQLYIQHLVSIFDEVKRVLKDTGTCWVNIGDTYGGRGGKGKHKDPRYADGRNGQSVVVNRTQTAKSLVQIPSRFAIAMTDSGWILRNEIIWHKPNCLPSSVRDRFTVDFEKLFFFTKSKKYYFEQQFEPMSEASASRYKYKFGGAKNEAIKKTDNPTYVVGMRSPTDGRNMRCVWNISTRPYKGSHFATFPPEIPERCIKAGSSEFGCCAVCGKPYERKIERKSNYTVRGEAHVPNADMTKVSSTGWSNPTFIDNGWGPTCKCGSDEIIRSVVLDPFGGSGTTAMVANQLGRDAIIIELNEDYVPLIEERMGLTKGLP